MDDSQKYFDHYLKGQQNGWKEDTPRVRLSLLDFSGKFNGGVVNRAENEYPLARQQLKTFYLDAGSNALSEQAVSTDASTTYDSATGAAVSFAESGAVCAAIDELCLDRHFPTRSRRIPRS